jgi:hypothetical protein
MVTCTRSASSHLAHFMLSPTPSTSGISGLAILGKIVFFKLFDLLISIVISQLPTLAMPVSLANTLGCHFLIHPHLVFFHFNYYMMMSGRLLC